MQLKISQRFFSIGDKFNIVDQNDQPAFLAREALFRFRSNCTLYYLDGRELYTLEYKFLSPFGGCFIRTFDSDVGMMDGRFHKPFVQKWRFELEGKKYILRSGGYKCKIFEADANWKYVDKSNPIAIIKKKVLKLADTYIVEFDEATLPRHMAALMGLWMDSRFHKDQH